MLDPQIRENLSYVSELFKSYRIKNAYVFGSSLGNEFNTESDIDFLINFEDDIESQERGKIWWELHDSLRDLFRREIDLLVESSLSNSYFIEEVNEKKQLIYAT